MSAAGSSCRSTASTTRAPERTSHNRAARWVAPALLCACVVWLAPWRLTDPDTLSRMAVGRLLVRADRIPRTDPFSALSPRWSNPEWLGDILLYRTHRALGERGLVGLKLGLLCAAWLLAFRLARTLGASPWLAAGVLLLALPSTVPRMTERNHLHLLWLTPLYLLLLRAAQRRLAALLVVAGLGLLWPNLHGSYPVSWVLVALALVGAALNRCPGRAKALAAVLAVHLAAPLLTPFGVDTYRQAWDHLTGWPVYSRLLVEWRPLPQSAGGHAWLGTVSVVLLATAVAACWWGGWKDNERPAILPVAHHLALTLALLVLAVASRRFVALCAVAAAPTIAAGLGWCVRQAAPRSARWAPAAVVLVSLALLAPAMAAARQSHRPPLLSSHHAPLAAAKALAARFGDRGPRVLAPYNRGPWLLWLVPGVKLYIDPRNTAGHRHLRRHVQNARATPKHLAAEVERHRLDAVVTETGSELPRAFSHPTFRQVYVDRRYRVFARNIK